ncbi:hypothetical protein [Spiroplasma endosymbiont of Asaphidion curtum]|uniref:hypothetical protein n=1 Tax=Spiroplasma endosymbiont of Asaphidion curtum TaxID=3066281 RepID=UPI00313CE28A
MQTDSKKKVIGKFYMNKRNKTLVELCLINIFISLLIFFLGIIFIWLLIKDIDDKFLKTIEIIVRIIFIFLGLLQLLSIYFSIKLLRNVLKGKIKYKNHVWILSIITIISYVVLSSFFYKQYSILFLFAILYLPFSIASEGFLRSFNKKYKIPILANFDYDKTEKKYIISFNDHKLNQVNIILSEKNDDIFNKINYFLNLNLENNVTNFSQSKNINKISFTYTKKLESKNPKCVDYYVEKLKLLQ